MRKILVVEDDQFFRDAICDLLKRKGFDAHEAPNGKLAQDIMMVQDFDVILSDIQMPKLTGIELLKWAKEKSKEVPFILMTGFSMLLETQTAYELGAREFITKPFKQNELLELIEKVVPAKKNSSAESPDRLASSEYYKVSIEEFVARPKIEFDLYISLSPTRFTKIAQTGDELDRERLGHYQQKGVKYLYLTKNDFEKLIALNLNIGHLIKRRSDISNEKKISFLKYTGEVILEKAFSKGVEKQSFDEAQTYLKITTDVLTDSSAHLDLLQMLSHHSDHVYAHSVGVTLFSIMIAKKMGFESSLALTKISMAALFHDIGKKEIDLTILNKPRYLLTSEERKIYESHPHRGKEILVAMKGISSDVIQIVHEHHEDVLGQGYPLAKKKGLHPLARIIHCANLFIELSLKDNNQPGRSATAAIQNMEEVYEGQVDKECMKALKSLYADYY